MAFKCMAALGTVEAALSTYLTFKWLNSTSCSFSCDVLNVAILVLYHYSKLTFLAPIRLLNYYSPIRNFSYKAFGIYRHY